MKQVKSYYHKKVLVLGLAKSGVSAATLLHKLGAFVTVNDLKPLSENPEAQRLLEQGITVICGEHPIELIDDGFELVVKNPGIPYSNPMVERASAKGIPVITEVELAYQISEAPIIGITGTNGKTTTTTLIYEMLKEASLQPLIAGNIGTVASDVAQNATKENSIVCELSSFQLMGIEQFRPKISVLLNLYAAHLDYHKDLSEYFGAKANITKNQTEDDFFIVNTDQVETMAIAKNSYAQVIPFSTKAIVQSGAYINDGAIYFKGENIISLDQIVLPGEHNLENILASISAAKLIGVPNDAIRTVLTTFQGVRHRLQYVGEVSGRKFYNDSKATNILAAKKALASFNEPTILLAGGLDRGNGFDELVPALSNVKAVITFGETAKKIEAAAEAAGIKQIRRVDNVENAVFEAYNLSNSGDIILLSPACASWDQYKSFEIRGDIFIEAVHKLK